MIEKIELYYDHYKDSFEQTKEHLGKRERYFIIAALLLITSVFTTFNPIFVQEISNAAWKVKMGIDLELAFYTINSAIIFLTLWYLIRYYQTVIVIENLYIYLQNLESSLSLLVPDFEISREGKSYLNPYPIIKNCINIFYQFIFPFLVIVAIFIKAYWEVFELRCSIPPLALIFNIICMILIIIMTLLYISWIHFKDFKKINS